MDKSEEHGGGSGSHKKQLNLNNCAEEEKDIDGEEHNTDHQADENFIESSHINEELGLQNEREIKRKNSYEVPVFQSVPQLQAADDVIDSGNLMFENNDSVQQNPNVEFGLNEMSRKRSADQIGNIGHIDSLRHGAMSNQRNEVSQGIDGTQPVFNSANSSRGTMLYERYLSGESIDQTRHMLNSMSSGGERILHSTLDPPPRPTDNQILDDPIQVLRNMNLPPHPISYSIIPIGGVHEHNMRTRSHPDMFSGNVIRHGPPVAEMLPPMVEMHHPPIVQLVPLTVAMRQPRIQLVPLTVAMHQPWVQMMTPGIAMHTPMIQFVAPRLTIRPPGVQMLPPMVIICTPVVQMNSHIGFVHDPTRPFTNINMVVQPGGEHGGRLGEGGHRDEAMSQHRRPGDVEQESTSRDAKRSKR